MRGFIPKGYLQPLYRPLCAIRAAVSAYPRLAYRVHKIIGIIQRFDKSVYRPPLSERERIELFGR